MSTYQKSVIIEANHLNSIEYKNEPNTEKANDFTIQIPPITLSKGSQITLDGCIINENGASNAEVLELSNQNFSSLYPYQSSFQAFEFLYYINHTGQNFCAAPLVSHNGFNLQQGDANKQNKIIISWKCNADIFYGKLVLGSFFQIPIQYPVGNFANRNAHSLRDYIYDVNGNITDENQAFSFFTEGKQPEKDGPNEAEYFTVDYWWYSSSPASCANGIKRNQPDGKKWVLIDASYKGPSYVNTPCKPLTTITKLDLSDKLLETPDEINFKINQTFSKSRTNAVDNLQDVNGLFYSTDTDPADIDTVENQFQVFNFSGETIKNIPCNLQTKPIREFYSHRGYSNMYVKDYKRWVGGHELYNLTQNDDDSAAVNYVDFAFGGLTGITDKKLDIYKDYQQGGYADNFHFWLRSLAVSIFNQDKTKPILNLDGNSQWTIQGTVPFGVGVWFFRWFNIGKNPDGSDISSPVHLFVAELKPDFFLAGEVQYYLVRLSSNNGIWEFNFDQTDNDENEPTLDGDTNVWTFKLDENSLFKKTFNIIYNINNKEYIINYVEQTDTDAARYLFITNNTSVYNGLPYLPIGTPNFGTQYGNEGTDDNTTRTGDYYTAIPRGHLIPINVKPVESVYQKWAKFCRLNEKYIGSKKTFDEQQKDVLNWYVDLDLGFHNDTAIGFFNGEESIRQSDEGKGGNICGFTFFENWFPTISRIQPENTKDRQQRIFSLGRFCEMGQEVRSKEHHMRVFSRSIPISNITIDNGNIIRDATTYPDDTHMGISPYIITEKRQIWEPKNKEYNVMLVSSLLYDDDATLNDGYGGYKNRCLSFVNFTDTFRGKGGADLITATDLYKGVSYNFQAPSNFRQMYRICSGSGIGFDPSATANPYGFAMNIQQSNGGNELVQVFRSAGFNSTIKYSSYIADYINRIYLGATSPTIDFNISRFELKNFHTPRKFNNKDSAATSIGIGDTVAIFNDKDMNFQTIELDATLKTQRLNDFLLGICDAVSGIGIYKIYVKDENTNVNLPILDDNGNINKGYLECKKDSDTGKAINWKKCLFDILGFSIEQLLPFYGLQSSRFDNSVYNSINGFGFGGDNGTLLENLERYKYTSFFTTNSYLSQINSQDMSLYPVNFPDSTTNTLKGTPDYSLGYVQFQKLALSVQTDVLRGQNLPSRIENPYYIIYSNLPTSGYSTNGNTMNAIAYVYKQYKTADFYYSYASSYQTTLTQDTPISMIRTAIYNSNGQLAKNIGSKSVFFYKAIMNMTLPEPEPEPTKETVLLTSIKDEMNKMNDLQEVNNLKLNNDYEKISVDEALKVLNKGGLEKMGAEGDAAIKSMENFITNYLITQIFDNNRRVITDYRKVMRASKMGAVDNKLTTAYNNSLLRALSKNKDDFASAFNSIMSEIINTAPANRSKLIKKIQKATRGRVSIPGLMNPTTGATSVIKRTGKGRKTTDFFLSASPDMLDDIKEILLSPGSVVETRELLKLSRVADELLISTEPLREYVGGKRSTKFSRGQLDRIIKKLRPETGTTPGKLRPGQIKFLIDNRGEIDDLIRDKEVSPDYGEVIDKYLTENPKAREMSAASGAVSISSVVEERERERAKAAGAEEKTD